MSNRQNRNRNPVKRAAKRRRQREAQGRSTATDQRDRPTGGQATHASSGSARKKARHGERVMETERQQREERTDDDLVAAGLRVALAWRRRAERRDLGQQKRDARLWG